MTGTDTVRRRSGRAARLLRGCVIPGVLCALAGGLAAPGQATAAEAAECRLRPDEQHTDWTGRRYTGDLLCEVEPGHIRLQSRSTSPVNGTMLYSPAWFVCWKRGSTYPGTDLWYLTQGDQVVSTPAAKAWGYVPATSVKAPSHPFPGLMECPWT
ncbi:hypothetical protein ABT390_34815 [Streptomyces aurantiacus]|uniref:Secreted protein n=1 Tax=Streptomyces aurantiacus JA 4570 TaxID=1286094 RepID=S3ZDH6_9ACTN|nr:hypothetical protein [Streptomyces aurantiacus]EPH41163.1 hypothetical protein STRAU_5815 [Streptomyces aurantiacus JA 4570]